MQNFYVEDEMYWFKVGYFECVCESLFFEIYCFFCFYKQEVIYIYCNVDVWFVIDFVVGLKLSEVLFSKVFMCCLVVLDVSCCIDCYCL